MAECWKYGVSLEGAPGSTSSAKNIPFLHVLSQKVQFVFCFFFYIGLVTTCLTQQKNENIGVFSESPDAQSFLWLVFVSGDGSS